LTDLAHILLGLGPVTAFLVALIFLDCFKLVRTRSVLGAVAVGALVAVACLYMNGWLLERLDLPTSGFSRYVAPIIEESLKLTFLVYLFRSHRIGFMVDAAIYGFAVGTGFALIENLYYFEALDATNLWLWVVRGFGTAILHGSTMVIFAIVSKVRLDGRGGHGFHVYLPGAALAMATHSAFNHLVGRPILATAAVLVFLPLLIVTVFELSEKATRRWLGVGLDTDTELLELITHHAISSTRVGEYLESLRTRFHGAVLIDMFCLLQISLELSIRVKGMLMARQAGFDVTVDDEIRAKLRERDHLRKSIGKAGYLALHPLISKSTHDLWQLRLLED